MTTYEEYRQLRRDCGFDDDFGMVEKVWNGCTPEAQENMLDQLRAGAAEVRAFVAERPGWAAWG